MLGTEPGARDRSDLVPDESEVVVVGAGIVGLTTALRLAQAGRDVLVIDRSEPFREGSGANAGTLALQNKPLELLPFYREGIEEWKRLRRELDGDIGHVQAGGLRVASTDADVETLMESARAQADLGVETEWLTGNSLRSRAPWLGPGIRCATYCRDDGFASPLLASRALLRAVESTGVRILRNVALVEREVLPGGFRVETTAGHIACESVVIATGPWTDKVARLFGIRLPVDSRVIMLSVTGRLPRFMNDLVVTHVAGRFTLKQFPNGTCILGGGFRGRGDIETGTKEVECDQLLENLRFQCHVVPRLKDASLVRTWPGFVGFPFDGAPAVGPYPSVPGLVVAISTGAGFTLGPAVGRLAAESVLSGTLPQRARAYDPARFMGQPATETQ